MNNGTGYQGSGEKSGEPEKGKKQTEHEFSVRGRRTMQICGVSEVISFDENSVVAGTACGEMTVEGSGLHIGALDIDRGSRSWQRPAFFRFLPSFFWPFSAPITQQLPPPENTAV